MEADSNRATARSSDLIRIAIGDFYDAAGEGLAGLNVLTGRRHRSQKKSEQQAESSSESAHRSMHLVR